MRKIIDKKEVREATGLSNVTVWRMERSGDFPKRVQLSSNRTGWFADEVEAWQNTRPRGIEGRIIVPSTKGGC